MGVNSLLALGGDEWSCFVVEKACLRVSRSAESSGQPKGNPVTPETKTVGWVQAPAITNLAWGKVEVAGRGPFRDAKIYPGGAREWDWRETGTHHVPGIQPADVEELIEHGVAIIVLSQGFWRRLQVAPETLALLAEKGIDVRVLPSPEAAERFNELRKREPVGCLIHSTC